MYVPWRSNNKIDKLIHRGIDQFSEQKEEENASAQTMEFEELSLH